MKNQKIARALLGFSIVIASAMWICTVSTAKITGIPDEMEFGLMQMMPLIFWIGFSFLVCAVVLAGLTKGIAYYPILFLVFLYFWVTPSFVENTARQQDSYWHASSAMSILVTGDIPQTNNFYYSGDWPGVFLLGAFLFSVLGAPVAAVIQFFPLLTGGMLFTMFYLLSKRVFDNERNAFISTIVFVAGAVYIQLHFSPMGLSTPLAVLFIYVATKKHGSLGFRILTLPLALTLVIFHSITPIWIATILLTYLLVDWIVLRRRQTNMIYSTVTFVFLLLAWNTFKNSLLNLSANVVHGLIIGGRLQYEYMPPLYTTPAIGYIRRSLIALYSFVGIVAMTIGIITIRKKKKLREDFVLAIALAASGFELVSMQFLFKVSQEFLPRELMYMTIGSSLALPIVLASGMFKNRACGLKRITALTRKGTLFVFFVSLLFLGIMTTYAQESNVKLCESELAGAKFVAHSMNPNISILYAENFGVIFFFNPRLVRNAFLTSNNPLIHDAIDRSGEIKENSIIVFEQTGYLQEQRALSMDLADSKPNWNRFCDSATYVGYYVDP